MSFKSRNGPATTARSAPYSRPSSRTGPGGAWLHDLAPGGRAAQASFAAPAASNAGNSDISNKLLVSNLHYEVMPKDLVSIFATIGTLVGEPVIRYDRSGRSTGVAVITFATAGEAIRAKGQMDGVLAKGKPMAIKYDPRAARPTPAAYHTGPTGTSLLNRISNTKPGTSLLQRLGGNAEPVGPGPQRNRAPRPARGGAPPAQPFKTRGGPKAKPKPKTVDDLDKELDAFMGEGEVEGAGAGAGAVVDADADMA